MLKRRKNTRKKLVNSADFMFCVDAGFKEVTPPENARYEPQAQKEFLTRWQDLNPFLSGDTFGSSVFFL